MVKLVKVKAKSKTAAIATVKRTYPDYKIVPAKGVPLPEWNFILEKKKK